MIYSLIISCCCRGINPQEFLTDVLRRLSIGDQGLGAGTVEAKATHHQLIRARARRCTGAPRLLDILNRPAKPDQRSFIKIDLNVEERWR